ncbi:MAG: hypothetical protein ABSF74_10600 [Dehalococcoidia bacterium]
MDGRLRIFSCLNVIQILLMLYILALPSIQNYGSSEQTKAEVLLNQTSQEPNFTNIEARQPFILA